MRFEQFGHLVLDVGRGRIVGRRLVRGGCAHQHLRSNCRHHDRGRRRHGRQGGVDRSRRHHHLHAPAVRALPVQRRRRQDVGFDVDIVDLVAAKLGVEQAIVDTPFEGIKSGQDLSTGKCDIAAAGMTITDERKKVILFSEPYFDATQALLVRDGDSASPRWPT